MVGLTFAWAGRSASIFQDKSFSEFILKDGAPIEGYLYSFQLSIMSVFIFLFTNLLFFLEVLDCHLRANLRMNLPIGFLYFYLAELRFANVGDLYTLLTN